VAQNPSTFATTYWESKFDISLLKSLKTDHHSELYLGIPTAAVIVACLFQSCFLFSMMLLLFMLPRPGFGVLTYAFSDVFFRYIPCSMLPLCIHTSNNSFCPLYDLLSCSYSKTRDHYPGAGQHGESNLSLSAAQPAMTCSSRVLSAPLLDTPHQQSPNCFVPLHSISTLVSHSSHFSITAYNAIHPPSHPR